MIPILCDYHISLCYLFALEVVSGHDFWTHLKMCWRKFDLLPLILRSGNVIDEMGCYVASMPVVMKFGTTD